MRKCFYVNVIISTLLLLLACGQKKTITSTTEEEINSSQSEMKLSIVEKIKENPNLNIEERIALYLKLKEESPEKYNFSNEDELTMYGYGFLWNDEVTKAIEIFTLILQEFNSPNSYDSLAEAYLKSGDKKKALSNYEKAFSLDPSNFNAEDQIELLKFPETKIETNAEKFNKVYTIQEYKDDLDQLGNRLLEVHPNALKFITKDDFWNIINEKKNLITEQTTYSTFRWHCNEIIANLNCSHTSLDGFYSEDDMLPIELRFPVIVRWIDDHLYISNPLTNKDLVKNEDEVISINGIAASDLVTGIYKHIQSQGYVETSKNHDFNALSSVLIPFALDFPETYTLDLKGRKDLITLKKSEKYLPPTKNTSIERCEDQLCFEIEDGIGIMTISSFNYYPWNNLDVFQEFIDKSFEKIKQKGVENLVIDLRFNGGGSAESSIHLLQYLMNKPFQYTSRAEFEGKTSKDAAELITKPFDHRYTGKVFFIIDGLGKSTTGHFMAHAKVYKLGPIIGEELGSNQFCSAGQKVCRLKNTKTVFYVANNTFVSVSDTLPDELGILPDHYVTQSIGEYLNKKDVVKEYALGLINK